MELQKDLVTKKEFNKVVKELIKEIVGKNCKIEKTDYTGMHYQQILSKEASIKRRVEENKKNLINNMYTKLKLS